MDNSAIQSLFDIPEHQKPTARLEPLPPIRLTGAPTFYRSETGWDWKPKPLPDYDLWLCLEGRGVMSIDGQNIPLAPGTGFIFAPGSEPRSEQEPKRRLRVFACHFTFESDPPPAWRRTRHLSWSEGSWLMETARRAAEAHSHEDPWSDQHARMLVETLIWQLVADGVTEAASARARATEADIARIAAAIREAPGERWLVGDMSADAKLSPSQFTRKFTEHTGSSPAHFVILTRLERAKHLLRETSMTVSAISDALGYHDVHFFCRQFKNFTGSTPGSLRK